jgi:hypothetical protein
MKAGAKWKEGADTCVFKPAVRCEGESDVRPGLSRVQSGDIATEERRVEEVLRTNFKELIEIGSVTISEHICKPAFTPEDEKLGEDIQVNRNQGRRGPCDLDTTAELTNFITPERGIPYAELVPKPVTPIEKYRLIRPVLEAAIMLVPDAGPWVIHTDLHTRNILVEDGKTTLIDWGRSIVITNPKDKATVQTAVNEWKARGLKPAPEIDYPAIRTALNSNVQTALRGWMPYTLLQQFLGGNWQGFLSMESQKDMLDFLKDLDREYTFTGGMYWPFKYYRGLTRRQNLQRKRSATRRTKMSFKNPKAYVPFKSDKGAKTRRSSYTSRFHAKYPEAKSLSEIAKETGISKGILQQVYDRGMAAWRTGHRPGASQHAWGMARVHSFVLKGKTWRTADADLARKV